MKKVYAVDYFIPWKAIIVGTVMGQTELAKVADCFGQHFTPIFETREEAEKYSRGGAIHELLCGEESTHGT